jgi:general secretion pathway protein G
MRKPIRQQSRGITLIELLVVMVIIALFATLVGLGLFRHIGTARQTVAKEQISNFKTALDFFKLDVGRYPTTEEGLQALRVKPAAVENWESPYLKDDVPLDPWGHTYVYRSPGQHGDFDLISYGADGQEGGEGENADIKNWK